MLSAVEAQTYRKATWDITDSNKFDVLLNNLPYLTNSTQEQQQNVLKKF